QQQYAYDALDRIKRIRQADANVVQLKYNAYNEVVETMDSKHRKVRFEYTPLGSLKEREENGKKVHFHYNTEEELLTITNEHEEFYRFARNENGEIKTETGFDGLTRQYRRDRAGKVLRVERPQNRFTEYEYDLNGRITRAEHHDGTWETYSYDQDGNLVEAVNEQSHIHLIRDIAGRVVCENQDGHLVESSYDKLGNRTKVTSTLGAVVTLSRKRSGYIEKVNATVIPKETKDNLSQNEADTKTTTERAWHAQFTYNSLGLETERALPGGIHSRMRYDEAGRPVGQHVSKANKELRHRTYAWSVNDKLTKMVNELTHGKVSYGYDDFNNLASARYENNQFDYKLPDQVGNLYRTKSKTDRKYGKGGQLLEADGNKFKYDEEGNLIQKIVSSPSGGGQVGVWDYSWYGNGMLKSVVTPHNGKVSFEYDALGRRTAKISMSPRAESRGEITRFVWDGNVPLHEWKYGVKDRPKFVVDEFGEISKDREEPIQNLTTWVFDEGTFKPAAKIKNGETHSIITDYLGTP
ncbi:MAG: type IV secretion protein Rhs, partial [Marinirhabdus sp.]